MRMRGERGASAVEFAIVASLLFMLLFGIVQFGIAYNRYQGLQAAAREGARLGSLQLTTVDDVRTRVRNSVSIVDGASLGNGCPSSLDSMAEETGCIGVARRSGSTLTPLSSGLDRPCNLQSGNTVVVTVAYRMKISIPLWSSPVITASADGEFRCE